MAAFYYDSVHPEIICPHLELSNEVYWVFVVCVVFLTIEGNRRSDIARSVMYASTLTAGSKEGRKKMKEVLNCQTNAL